jgi:hypothetical protein
MLVLNLFLGLLLQAPAPVEKVVVGLLDGREIVIENPEFSGFIQGRGNAAVLNYRQQKIHGRMQAKTISRIEFGPYRKEGPFVMTLMLKDGQKLLVESEWQDYLMLRGNTVLGPVMIKHPDPISPPLQMSTKKPDRQKDLTIRYLEFPASSE